MHWIGIIPARYASTRFPGKPLVDIQGKPMIRRVYEQACQCNALASVWVATDDSRIQEAVVRFGGNCVMTSSHHPSGTDRCREALEIIQSQEKSVTIDGVLNIQGDEPFVRPETLQTLCEAFAHPHTEIATLVKKIEDPQELWDPNTVKCLRNSEGFALYFSRQALPYCRNVAPQDWLQNHTFWKHLGVYAYRSNVLRKITQLEPSLLEQTEGLEQLRWIENHFHIHTQEIAYESISIDTPDDLLLINKIN